MIATVVFRPLFEMALTLADGAELVSKARSRTEDFVPGESTSADCAFALSR